MKLVRLGKLNEEKPAVLVNGQYVDVSAYFQDFNEDFFTSDGLNRLK
jgi:hypothetical protein